MSELKVKLHKGLTIFDSVLVVNKDEVSDILDELQPEIIDVTYDDKNALSGFLALCDGRKVGVFY